MQSTNDYGSRRASLHARVSADGAAFGPLHTRTGLPLPARAGVRRARLHAEGTSKTREKPARKANPPTGPVLRWPSMNEHGAAPHQPLIRGAWKEEGIGTEVTLTRTVRGRTTTSPASTSGAPHDATRPSRSKPPTRWGSTRSSVRWKWSS